ncbi:hypothetical protein GWL_40830 [Herbaspirillum sp. GW103]|nr:hypothetical protein GWL_40830 [Herbaspirillum sp. GW103]
MHFFGPVGGPHQGRQDHRLGAGACGTRACCACAVVTAFASSQQEDCDHPRDEYPEPAHGAPGHA